MSTAKNITARVLVVRSGHGSREFEVSGTTPAEIRGAALALAGDHEFSESDADYSIESATDAATGEPVGGVADDDIHGPRAREMGAEMRRTGVPDDALDDMVHDLVSARASEINNAGIEEQIAFLLGGGVTEDEIRAAASAA